MTAVTRSRDGVPQWDGDAATFQDYEEQSLQWEQSQPYHKRYLGGPKLIAELSGAARKHVMGKRPDWVSYDGGVAHLLQHLRTCLGRPTIPEMTEYLNRFFRQSRRRRFETMNAYVTRKMEVDHRARQALFRVQKYYDRRHQGRQQWQQWNQSWHDHRDWGGHQGWGYQQWNSQRHDDQEREDEDEDQWYDADAQERQDEPAEPPRSLRAASSYDPSEDEHWKLHTDELLPEFLQGWYLLVDSGLEAHERNMIQTAVLEDFSVQRISQELRRQWPDDELKKRDQSTKGSSFWNDLEDDEDYDIEDIQEGYSLEGLTEEGQVLYGEAAEDIQQAQAVIQQARRTLRDARARQHQARLSRQYYKTSSTSYGQKKTSFQPDSRSGPLKCLRCGKAHRTTDCPDRQGQVGGRTKGDQAHTAAEAAPFVCFSEEAAVTDDAMTSFGPGKSTQEAMRQGYGVIDGGATKTLGSIEAIQTILDLNEKKHGCSRLAEVDTNNRPTFGFGNSSQDTCVSTASLEVSAGNRPGTLQVHALDKGNGPVLISVQTLRRLKAVIDFDSDTMVLRALDPTKLIQLERSASGHQLLPLTDDLFKNARTCTRQVPGLQDFC